MKKTTLAGRFELLAVIGRGGQGDVFLARDLNSGDYAAIKSLPKEQRGSEGKLLSELSCPGIPRFRSEFRTGAKRYLAMDYIEGETLKEILLRRTFHEEEVKDIARQLLEILDYLHRQDPPMIYLDLKPSNIILDRKKRIFLVDFGIAKRKGEEIHPGLPVSALTRGFAAPEQYLSKGRFDERTDLYALGVTLHYLLTRKNPNEPPFEFAPVTKLNSSVSEGFSQLIEKLLQPSPKDRFQSAAEVMSELLAPKKRRPVKKKLIFAAAAVFAAGMIFALLPSKEPEAATLPVSEEVREASEETFQAFEESEEMPEKSAILSLKPAGGTYPDYLLAKADFDPEAGRLYYTTDGIKPTKKSSEYTDGIVVSAPETEVRLLQIGFDGETREYRETYHITKKAEEVSLSPEEPGAWEIYYRLKKPWGDPVYNYELAQIRHLTEEEEYGVYARLKKYMVFYKEETGETDTE